VIDGWNEGLIGAQAGGRRQLDIPAAKAYGDNPPSDPIKPGDDLTFVIDIRAVVPAADPAAEPQVTVQPTSGSTETTHTELVEGTGAEATAGSTAILQYIAFNGADGAKLESSWVAGGQPMTVTVGNGEYLAGIDKGVEGMKVGGRRQVTITPEDGFGPDGNEQLGLPAGADLIIVFDLVAVY
jgi:peptidylprolyl isomerase